MDKKVEDAFAVIRASGAQPRYVDPPLNGINARLKFWLTLIPIVTILGSFGAGYGGGKYRDGEEAAERKEQARQLAEVKQDYVRKELYLQSIEDNKGRLGRIEAEISEARRVRSQK